MITDIIQMLKIVDSEPIMTWAAAIFFIIIFIEMYWSTKERLESYNKQDAWASIGMGIGSAVVNLFSKFIAILLFYWVYQYRIITLDSFWWGTWILLFFADDFAFYTFHRSCHEIRLFWCGHVNHHSSLCFNFSTAIRQGWGEVLTRYIWWLWLPLIGIHPLLMVTQMSLSIIYQFFLHTEYVKNLGPLEKVLNTPSSHRVHHGSETEYLDKNYGGILIIWDKLFGTYQKEIHHPIYGLTKNIDTYNPFQIAFHEYIALFQDVKNAPGIVNKLKYIYKPPGWSHQEKRVEA